MTPADGPRAPRSASLDALRGLAVSLMVAWHVTDGWLADAWRAGPGWQAARVIGGLAAPLFLTVAGLAVGLARRRGVPLASIARRGVGLVALGGLLQIQLWLVDAGGLLAPEGGLAMAAGLLGFGAMLLAARRRASPLGRGGLGVSAAGLLALYVWRVRADLPEHAARLLAVDVLSCIGVSVIVSVCARALACRLARATGREATAALALLGAAVVVLAASPALSNVLAGPDALTAWLGRTLDPAQRAYARFPLTPWCAYALLGCAAASLRAPRPRVLLVIGVTLALVSFEGGLPWTRRLLHDQPMLRPLVRCAFHAGAMLALGALAGAARDWPPLRALGRASLPVYWLHLELAYGLASIPFARGLDPMGCAVGALAIVAAAAVVVLYRPASKKSAPSPHTLPRHVVSSPNSRA